MDAHAAGLDGPSLFIHPAFCETHRSGFATAESPEGEITYIAQNDPSVLIGMACGSQKAITVNTMLASRASTLGMQDDGNFTQQGSGEMIHTKPLLKITNFRKIV